MTRINAHRIKMSSIFILLTVAFCTGQCLPVRETVFGKVRGKISTRVPDRQVEEYLGIPYASPPIGHLRFKRPKDPMIWKPSILITTELPPACPQSDVNYVNFHKPGFMSFYEDCLYMNIYVPKVDKVALPVLFFIHGGSNTVGMGAMFDGDILAAHGEIIVITFNYRLNDLGFYADPSNGIKGNNGLMDQVLAMKWVNRNIKYFNGDPSKVTIHGHSAGAMDAALHLLSSLTKGLFRNAIIHSGSPVSPLALSPCVRTSRMSAIPENCRLGTSLVVHDEHQKAINTLLEGGDGYEYYLTNWSLQNNWIVVDGDFLTDSPEYLFTCGQFHADLVLIMMARDEAWPLDMSELEDAVEDHSMYNTEEAIESLASEVFPERPEFKEAIKKELKKWKTLDLSRYPDAMVMLSDVIMIAPIMKLADMIFQKKNVYTLSFEYISQNKSGPDWIGVQHGWDLFYVFGLPTIGHPNFSYTPRDADVSKTTMRIISDFVKEGHWGSYSGLNIYNPERKSYNKLDYANDQVVLTNELNFKKPRLSFWFKYLYPWNFTCGISS